MLTRLILIMVTVSGYFLGESGTVSPGRWTGCFLPGRWTAAISYLDSGQQPFLTWTVDSSRFSPGQWTAAISYLDGGQRVLNDFNVVLMKQSKMCILSFLTSPTGSHCGSVLPCWGWMCLQCWWPSSFHIHIDEFWWTLSHIYVVVILLWFHCHCIASCYTDYVSLYKSPLSVTLDATVTPPHLCCMQCVWHLSATSLSLSL